ncbi:(2Fe-2S)-binding protein [Nocardiopsis xinjiangensis]|uniref:(2Fe-2S)-binding protein n=1 Tax=Nocardiopsis xinjiangensis TaxID=124285 RepID=UPI000344F7D3|nr:(2Fe-2S)-binding protein [Nocardiopsis xinjiangensis]
MGEDVAVGPVLERVGRINMMFALEQAACAPGRRRLDGAGLGVAVVAGEVERTRARLALLSGTGVERVEWRVAASLLHQGLASRVLSPVVAAALCHGVGIEAHRLHWDPERTGGSIALATDQGRAVRVPEGSRVLGGAADWVGRTVLDPEQGVLGRVEAALAGAGRVSPRLLRGNAASALVGAVGALGAGMPGWGRAGRELAGELLARPGLELSGSCTGPAGQERFVRTTCCLYYRLGGGGLCGDCALG